MTRRESSRSALGNHALSAALLAAIALVANAIATRHSDHAVDLTADGENTLAAGTLQTLKTLPDRVRVRAFFTRDLPPEAAPHLDPARNVVDRLERASGGRVAVEYLDPTEAKVAEEVKKLGIAPSMIQVRRHDRFESAEIYFGLELRCGDRPPRTIPFLDLQNPEYELARALKAVGDAKTPTIGFLTREPPAPPKVPGMDMPMSPERIFERLRELLRDRYRVVDLYDARFGQPIPPDVEVLVLAKPRDLDERERFEVDQFVMRGGRLLVLHEKHEYDLRGTFEHKAIETGIDPLLERWGIRIAPDVLAIDSAAETIRAQAGGPNARNRPFVPYCYFPVLTEQSGGFSAKHPITKALRGLSLYWASPVDVLPDRAPSIVAEDLLSSSEMAFRTKVIDDVKPDAETSRRATAKVTSETPARQRFAVALYGKFPSAFAGKPVPPPTESRPAAPGAASQPDERRTVLAESHETRVVVVGDADFARNELLSRAEGAKIFLGNAVDWLVLDQALISIRSRGQTRMLRDLELEEQKALGGDPSKPRSITSFEELKNVQDEMQRTSNEARERADRKRATIKLANMFGPGAVLIAFGILRLVRRSRERRLAAEAAA